MRIVILDNFDSFTHNLAQLVGGLGCETLVRRNLERPEAVLALAPSALVLSPGPGGPGDSGLTMQVLAALPSDLPVLGVCLGMQVLAQHFGGEVVRAPTPVHGWATALEHDGCGVFRGLNQGVLVGRYHSLRVADEALPAALQPTAWSEGVLMGLRHATRPLHGIQFHPESVLTPCGRAILANFLALSRAASPR